MGAEEKKQDKWVSIEMFQHIRESRQESREKKQKGTDNNTMASNDEADRLEFETSESGGKSESTKQHNFPDKSKSTE